MRDRARRAAESEEREEARLEQLRSYQARRIAAERVEDREARLQQLRINQDQTIAAESAEEREVRLQQVRTNYKGMKTLMKILFMRKAYCYVYVHEKHTHGGNI